MIPSARRLARLPSPLRRHPGLVALATSLPLLIALGCTAIQLPFGWTINFPGFSGDPLPESQLERQIKLPPGFTITTYAGGIENARFMRFTPTGDLLVSAPRQGKVFLVEHGSPGSPVAAGKRVLLDGLDRPHGMVLHGGWLYVAESGAVLRVRFDPGARAVQGAPERIINGLPAGGNHWTRTIGVGPDGKLYVSIGSSCNVCIEDDKRRASIVRYELDGSGEHVFATGLRNSVGFAWQPGTGALYATDNGRDLLGDDFPPDELNLLRDGEFYGWPYANGDKVPDPDYGAQRPDMVARSLPPVHPFGAHVATLGIAFYEGTMFPERYHGAAFVAQHGSWNRSTKSGYQVVALFFPPGEPIREEPFATGFQVDEKVAGRPVDVAVGPDGALYVSDDFTGQVYRIAYGERALAAVSAPRPSTTEAAPPPARVADPLAGTGAAERERAKVEGKGLWDANGCKSCHEPGSREVYRPLDKLSAKYTIDSLVEYLRTPQPPMPVFPLSDEQRRELAIYLLEVHP
jgi:glucose/arabinose dehydrogenase